ncbi:LAMI_0C00804g1_1 [Lachancea mirantina]|uniref:LAMI_0C00804g1_1 n=1 Tax=Lachancea mirantina TaxID=1230905 RepID=A0A1G4IZU8_9SACH|nr:LAMI_0C00804g1_1 [Lachancea mirantina]
MLMDRNVKLLYRQRGSALRKVGQDIVFSGTKDVNHEAATPGYENEILPALDPIPDFEHDQQLNLSQSQHHTPEKNAFLYASQSPAPAPAGHEDHLDLLHSRKASPQEGLQISYATHGLLESPPSLPPSEEPVIPSYDFTGVPLSKLPSSITSITSIDVLIALFANLFDEQLIPKSHANYDTAISDADKLSFQMDVDLFNLFKDKILGDMRDLLDINISNNNLCSLLRQALKSKRDLSSDLLEVRKQIHEWEMKIKEEEKPGELESKLALNEQLKELGNNIRNAHLGQSTALVGNDDSVSDFVRYMDPHNGASARLKAIIAKLEEIL